MGRKKIEYRVLSKKELIEKLKEVSFTHPTFKIGLFGSRVRETNKINSDIDILCATNPLGEIDYDMFMDLWDELERIFSPFKVDLVNEYTLKVDCDKLDETAKLLGGTIEENAPYRNILKEVEWV